MRILHALPKVRAEVGGPARGVVDLCAALARRGHQVTLATTDDTEIPQDWKRNDRADLPRVALVPAPTLPGQRFSRVGMDPFGPLIDGHDLVHVHGVWELMNIQICRAAAKAGKPYFVTVRGMLDDWAMSRRPLKKHLYLSLVGRRWLRGAARMHLTAKGELAQASTRMTIRNGVVIPNLLDLSPYERLPGPELAAAKFSAINAAEAQGRPKVLFLSRLHTGKGLEPLLGAMRVLKDRRTPCSLLIAGSGEEGYVTSIKDLASRLALTPEDVSFLGFVTGELKLSLYQASDLFALPTSQENFGFVLVESLACGTPVVTTKGADIWPELESSGGVVIAPPTAEAFADAIGQLIGKRRAEIPAMGERGRNWVFTDLDPQRIIERFEAMYRLEI